MAVVDNTERPQFNELERFSLFTPTPGVQGKRAKLSFVEFNNNARISVFTNHPDDAGKVPISAPMGPDTFLMFLETFETIVNGPNDRKGMIECYKGEIVDGKSTGNKFLSSTVYYGKDAEGLVYILVKAEGRPEVQFHFGLSDYHVLKLSDGSATPAFLSQCHARGIIFALRDTFTRLCSGFRKPGPSANSGQQKMTPAKKTEFEDIDF